MRIFISHSTRDKALVREIASHFPSWLKPWIDEESLMLGADLAASFKDAIRTESDYVVLLFGRDALHSKWIKKEISWALSREAELDRVFVLPVVLDGAREHLSDFGLGGRFHIELAGFSDGGTRLLAEELTNHVAGWMSEMLATTPAGRRPTGAGDSLDALGESVISLIAEVQGPWRSEVERLLVRPFVNDLAATRIGIVPLTATQYYQCVLAEISRANETTEILAVSTLSSELWSRDADQTLYADRNIEAADRGTRVRRLFVLPAIQAGPFAAEIERQRGAGIETKVAAMSLLANVPDLEDFVLFSSPEGTRAYVAQPSIDGSKRVRAGMLVLSDHAIARLRDAFDAAWGPTSSSDAFFDRLRSGPKQASVLAAPGVQLQVRRLGSPVITCEEAAQARGVPLANELKTLVLQTQNGMVAAHLPGDGTLSLRKVKSRLETAEAYLVDPEDLFDIGLSAGTVSAVLEPVWSMPHLISRRLLVIGKVTTNDGTRTGYFEFDPAILTEAADVIVDDFER